MRPGRAGRRDGGWRSPSIPPRGLPVSRRASPPPPRTAQGSAPTRLQALRYTSGCGLAPRHVVGRGPGSEEPVQSRAREDEGYDLPRRRAGQPQPIARREARHRLLSPGHHRQSLCVVAEQPASHPLDYLILRQGKPSHPAEVRGPLPRVVASGEGIRVKIVPRPVARGEQLAHHPLPDALGVKYDPVHVEDDGRLRLRMRQVAAPVRARRTAALVCVLADRRELARAGSRASGPLLPEWR